MLNPLATGRPHDHAGFVVLHADDVFDRAIEARPHFLQELGLRPQQVQVPQATRKVGGVVGLARRIEDNRGRAGGRPGSDLVLRALEKTEGLVGGIATTRYSQRHRRLDVVPRVQFATGNHGREPSAPCRPAIHSAVRSRSSQTAFATSDPLLLSGASASTRTGRSAATSTLVV